MSASPMKTMIDASTGALAKGRTTRRSMTTPPIKETTTVTANARQ